MADVLINDPALRLRINKDLASISLRISTSLGTRKEPVKQATVQSLCSVGGVLLLLLKMNLGVF